MYDAILVPTDGSEVAETAVEHALDLADRYGAELHTLYIVDTGSMDMSFGTEQVERLRAGQFGEMEGLESQARHATGRVARRAEERGLSITEHIRAGQPHVEIIDYADENDIDLVVMGSHGRGGVQRFLLGSVAERVLRTTHQPVLVVGETETED